MKKKIHKFGFLTFLFIFFFTILNIIIFPLIQNMTITKNSFLLIFSFWFLMIFVLFVIDYTHQKDLKE